MKDFLLRYWWTLLVAAIGLGGAWATLGQEIRENTKHREAVAGLPEQVQAIAAATYYRDCVEDGTPKKVCQCEREELAKPEPLFRRCDMIAERLIRAGQAERVQVVIPDTAGGSQ